MTQTRNPIVIRAGKAGRKRIEQLERGQGKLMEYVQEAMQHVHTELGAESSTATLIPIVLIVRRKRKRSLFGLN
jgi:hypothetical protein